MEKNNTTKIKKRGNFYVTKIIPSTFTIRGVYFDTKYEKMMKIKDRQTYVWFSIFAVLEGLLRPYIFEIVLGLGISIVIANVLFYFMFINTKERVNIKLQESEFYEVAKKKHKVWQQALTMSLVFVCLTRLIIFVQPGVVSSERVMIVYGMALTLCLLCISFWIYYGKIKNMNPHQIKKTRKKKVTKKQKKMKYIQ
ncbi:MAG: hypothetical protein RR562_04745 [Longicatena sp.]